MKFAFQNLDLENTPLAYGMTRYDELEDAMMPKNISNNRIFDMLSHCKTI